jgi:hypothetical protein
LLRLEVDARVDVLGLLSESLASHIGVSQWRNPYAADMVPSLAVGFTWVVIVLWCLLLGAFAGQAMRPKLSWPAAARVSLWTGFAILVLLALVPNFFIPLASTAQLVIALVVTVLAAIAWVLVKVKFKGEVLIGWTPPGWWVLVPVAALAVLILLFAHLSFGPLTNYDSGLYHLNAIQFAAEYRTIPGLANMSDRLGTNVSAFNLAAGLSSSPWGIEVFRILVGLFVVLAATDMSLRLADGDRRSLRQPGFYVLGLSLIVSLPFIASDAPYWLTSPSPDTTSLLMTIVAGAYLADALADREAAWTQVALVTAALAASIRTQLWVFFALVALALLFSAFLRKQPGHSWWRPSAGTALGIVLAGITFLVMMARDVILSGWLLFPAPYAPMPVKWRVTETTGVREWLLAWARSPGTDPAETLSSWSWFWPWLGVSINDWAIRGAVGLLGLMLVIHLASHVQPSEQDSRLQTLRGLATLLAVAAPIVTVVVWFFTAPDPRFAWGAILLIGAIPAGFAFASLGNAFAVGHESRWQGIPLSATVLSGFLVLAVLPVAVGGLLQMRGAIADGWEPRDFEFGPVTVTAVVSPVPVSEVQDFTLNSGQKVTVPVGTDQCWMAFPLCRPYPDPTIYFPGISIEDGVRDSN